MRRRGFASGGCRSSKTVDRTASQSALYLLGLKAEAPHALGGGLAAEEECAVDLFRGKLGDTGDADGGFTGAGGGLVGSIGKKL